MRRSLLIASFALLPTALMAKGDVVLSLKEEGGGITIGIESNSIYNSTIELPIVIAPSVQDKGVSLGFVGANGKRYSLCAQIDYSDIPRRSTLHFQHKISVHETFGNLKKLYCLSPGRYVVHGSYKGVYLDGELSLVESNDLNIDIEREKPGS